MRKSPRRKKIITTIIHSAPSSYSSRTRARVSIQRWRRVNASRRLLKPPLPPVHGNLSTSRLSQSTLHLLLNKLFPPARNRCFDRRNKIRESSLCRSVKATRMRDIRTSPNARDLIPEAETYLTNSASVNGYNGAGKSRKKQTVIRRIKTTRLPDFTPHLRNL